ncbi:MAG: transcription elongation factor GreA [Holdemanella sp.]|nr:transcription elongation factor GreA [Holdemanella sp.]
MANEKIYVTQEGLDELERELYQLIHVTRKEVIVELQEARAQGDLSENADYDAAREHQRVVEERIHELEAMIKKSELIKETETLAGEEKTVKLASTVRFLDLSENMENTFTIVGSVEADPLNGKLSNNTPLAEAMIGHKAGDIVTVKRVEVPYDVEILEIK